MGPVVAAIHGAREARGGSPIGPFAECPGKEDAANVPRTVWGGRRVACMGQMRGKLAWCVIGLRL